MDTISHSAQGALMYRPIHLLLPDAIPLWFHLQMYFIFALIAAWPDIYGWLGLKLNGTWEWYLQAHSTKKENIFWLIPMSKLHIWEDTFTHGDGKRWWVKGEGLSKEIWNWVITLILIAIAILV